MRLAFFSVRMQIGNGVDLTIHEIARRLVTEYSHEVDVWTPTSDGTYDNEPYALKKILVYGAEWNRFLPILEMNANKAMRKLAADGVEYDLVIPCTHPFYGAGKAYGVPSVFFNFGNVPTSGFSWKGKLNWAWLDFSENTYHKANSAQIISISQFLHHKQSKDLQRKSTIQHLAGDHYGTHDERRRREFRQRLGLNDDEVALGYCGRLFKNFPEYKGTHKLLELSRRLKEVEPKAKLVMCGAGSGDDGKWVAESGAIPLLNLPPPEMPGFYDALDIYVCASRWEGFNLPIVEAAWHNVPSIAYEIGAHAEHVTSVLVEDNHFDELCSAALTLVRDQALRDRFAAEAWQKAQAFSWDQVAKSFNAILVKVAP